MPRCLARRSSATFDVGTSRWPSSRPPAGSSQGGAEPIGVLCGAVLRFQHGGAFAVGTGTTAGVLKHLAELRVKVLHGCERCCCPRHQLAPVSGPGKRCGSFGAPERCGSRHSITKRTLLASFLSPRCYSANRATGAPTPLTSSATTPLIRSSGQRGFREREHVDHESRARLPLVAGTVCHPSLKIAKTARAPGGSGSSEPP